MCFALTKLLANIHKNKATPEGFSSRNKKILWIEPRRRRRRRKKRKRKNVASKNLHSRVYFKGMRAPWPLC